MENSTGNSAGSSESSSGSFAFGIFVEIMFVWIIFGNVIIIAVLKLYKPLTIPDILIFSLALSDLLNVLLPAQILNIIQSHFFDISWNKSICATFTVLVYCFRLSSVLTVSVISLDRLIAIRKPLLYRSRVMHEIGRVKVLILILWLFSCFTASLPFMGVSEWSFKNNECQYQLLDLGLYYGFYIEILGLLQLALVLYCYVAIRISTWHFLKRQDKFRRVQLDSAVSNPPVVDHDKHKVGANAAQVNREGSKKESTNGNSIEQRDVLPRGEQKVKRGSFKKHFGSRRRESTTPSLTEGMKQVAKMEKMMAVLVFLFYLTWIPFLGSNLYSLVTRKSNKNVTKIIGVFSLINGFLNPIVYATIYPRYKKGYIFVFRSILRICGGKKPSITLADFNSSKIGRSRRLQTLKELKLNSNAARKSEVPQVRQGWLKSTSSTTAIISEEQKIEMESVRDNHNFRNSINGDFKQLSIEEDDKKDGVNRECEIDKDTNGVANHFSDECIVPNCVKCEGKNENVSKSDIRNVVSPTFVQIATLNSSESAGRVKSDSDLDQSTQLPKAGPFHLTDSKDFAKYKLNQDTVPGGSTCNHNSMVEMGDCITEEEHVNCEGDSCNNVIKNNQALVPFEEINSYSSKRTNHEKSYPVLPNSACLNNGFTEDEPKYQHL